MDAPLTPNTSAFLSYLSSALDNNNNSDSNLSAINNNITTKDNPTSLPPSAFFPVPGRDTPEDTPPSSNETSQSPENAMGRDVSLSADDSEGDSPDARRKSSGQGGHKRKAGATKQIEEDDDDDDSGSDSAGHDDKRQQPNAKTGGRKGGRKSTGEDGAPRAGKDVGKAARRKEQNRAAQKAFRERREAKVKDLEDKVAELEAKSYGTSVENENLRGILKRLQEENVALRQAAFTFSMPVNGQANSGSGTNTPTQPPQPRQTKPPTPPHSVSDDSLRSVNDLPNNPRRSSSNLVAMGESPESLNSVGSASGSSSDANANGNRPVDLFDKVSSGVDAFSAGALGGPRLPAGGSISSMPSTASRSDSGISPQSSSSNSRTEIEALWASFLQPAKEQQNNNPSPAWNYNDPTSYTMLNSTNLLSTPADVKVGGPVNGNGTWDKTAFRDDSNSAQAAPAVQPAQQQAGQQPADPWANMVDNSVDDFLASLTGGVPAGVDADIAGDDDFNAQLQQILGAGASPSAAFNLPTGGSGNPFSPTNYLNMSPTPLNSISNGPSPISQTQSCSNSASPASSSGLGSNVSRHDPMGTGVGTFGPPKSEQEHVYVVDDNGKVIKPSELWVKMGMQHESNLEHLLIDDLCDMMRQKATCQDGRRVINAKDAAFMFNLHTGADATHDTRMRGIEQRAGLNPGTLGQVKAPSIRPPPI